MSAQAQAEFQADQGIAVRRAAPSRYSVHVELLAALVAGSLIVGIAAGFARGDFGFALAWAKWCAAYWTVGFAVAQPLAWLWEGYEGDGRRPTASEVVNLRTTTIIAWPVAAVVALAFVPLVLLLRRLFPSG